MFYFKNTMAGVTISSVNKDVVAFDPRSIGGCALWWDATDTSTLTLSGTTVTNWRDKSGSGRTFTTYGPGTVTYDSVNKYVRTGSLAAGAGSSFYTNVDIRRDVLPFFNIFMVYKWLNNTQVYQQGLFGSDVLGGWNRMQTLGWTTSSRFKLGLGVAVTPVNTPTNNLTVSGTAGTGLGVGTDSSNQQLYSLTASAGVTGATVLYINGSRASAFSTESSTASTATTNTYFANINDGASYGEVGFYEILIYNVSITTQQRLSIEGYLAWKWGLQTNLPTTHPFRYVAPRGNTFSPLSISTCSLWIDAADSSTVTTSGTTVTAVKDKSGFGNDSISVANTITYLQNGINGLPVFSFPGTAISGGYQRIFGPITSGTNTVTAYTVCVFTAGSTNARVLSFCPLGQANDYDNTASFTMYEIGTQTNRTAIRVTNVGSGSGYPFVFGNTLLWGIIFNNANANLITEGTPQTATTTSTASFTYNRYAIGDVCSIGTSERLQGYVGEVVVYNKALTDGERQQLEGYLANKWGVRTSLPTANPFQPFRSSLLPQSPLFLPNQLTSTLSAWWDGRDPNNNVASIPADTATVATWTDKSGNANNGTGGVSPTYSKTLTGVTFNGSTQFLTTSVPAYLNSETIFCVLTFSSVVDRYIIATNSASAGGRFLGITGSKLACGNVNTTFGATITSPILTANVKIMFTYVCTSGSPNNTTQLYLYHPNGSSTASAALVAYSGTSTTNIGNNVNNGYFPGTLHELIIVPATLGLNDIQRMEGYLAWKWSINNLLPTTHPYRKIKP